MQQLKNQADTSKEDHSKEKIRLGGGTDLVVQKALAVKKSSVDHLFDTKHLQEIKVENGEKEGAVFIIVLPLNKF